jgi:DNA-binding NarL/FixJ family response regulator
MTSEKIDIWIVEDDPFLRESYVALVESSDRYVVTRTFHSGEEATTALSHLNKGNHYALPKIILMDIELPGMSGVECTDRIKAKFQNIIIIMVTVYEDSELVFNSLKAGASGYITKSSDYVQLIGAINEILEGGAPMSSKIAKLVIESFHRNYNSPLSKRESQILQLVAAGKTFTQISEQLFIARETTKTHIRNIYRKLEVNCRADAIAKATKEHLI